MTGVPRTGPTAPLPRDVVGSGLNRPTRFLRQVLSSINPSLAAGLGSFRHGNADVPATAHGRTVAVIGRLPSSGTSTVVALMALCAAGYTDNRVLVIETNRRDAVPGSGVPGSGVPGRSIRPGVTTLLGGSGDGRLPVLLAVPDGEAVARSRVRAAGTRGTAVPVLELPAGAGNFAPQVLERTLTRLRHRADLTVIDTPTDRSEPVFHAVLHLVDHVLLVVPADRTAPERLAASLRWLDAAPGPERQHDLSVVLVAQSRFVPRWRPSDLPWTMLRWDGALKRGHPGRMSRRSVISGLQLVDAVSGGINRSSRRA